MDLSAFAKDPSFLLRRRLTVLISHTPRLYETPLLQKHYCHHKERAQHAAPLRYSKDPSFLLRRCLTVLISHTLRLYETPLLQKHYCHHKERAQHAAPLRY